MKSALVFVTGLVGLLTVVPAAADGSSSSGGAPPPAPIATPKEESPIPAACDVSGTMNGAKVCMPNVTFAKKMCAGVYPELALAMFSKGTPWTRVWLAGDVEAWNANGGRTHTAKLAFDEEVIVLARHAAASMGGIVMTGAQANYDVLRFDGTCVSVMEGELTTRRPPAPKPAAVTWSRLEEGTRRALLASPKIKAQHDSLDKACSSGAGKPFEKKTCERADKALTQAVADYVRGTSSPLPTPARRPQ